MDLLRFYRFSIKIKIPLMTVHYVLRNENKITFESRSIRLALEESPLVAASSPRLVSSSCLCCNASMTVRGSGAFTT